MGITKNQTSATAQILGVVVLITAIVVFAIYFAS